MDKINSFCGYIFDHPKKKKKKKLIGASIPAVKTYLFESHARRGSPVQPVSLHLPLDDGRSLPAGQLTFSILRPESLAHPSCEYPSPVGWRREPPGHLTLPFCLYLSDTWVPISRRTPARALPARQHYLFKSHAQATLTRPTQQVLCSPRTSARASQPDKLTVSVRPHHNIETPSNATYPVGQAILAFSPPPVRLNHPTREYWSPVGCRESLPAGQPHLFLLHQRR